MMLLALYGLVVGIQVYSCGEHTTVSSGYILVCAYMLIACPFGLYGAIRVTSDVEAEIGSMEAVEAAKQAPKGEGGEGDEAGEEPAEETVSKGEDDDGLGTVGQNLIAGFFVASMFGVMMWLILAVEAFDLADEAMLHNECSHQDSLMATLGWLGILSTLLLIVGSYFVGRVVSGYYLARTVVMLLNIALIVLGVGLFLFAITLVNQIICLSDGYSGYSQTIHKDEEGGRTSGLEESMGTLIMFGLIALSGYSLAMVSAMGHFAATRLSRSLLERHVRALTIWMIFSFIFSTSTMLIGSGSFVSAHCEDLLYGLSMEWFEEELQCPKYVGAGETWNGTGWSSTTIGPSEMPSCVKKWTRFAWEINPVQRAGGGGEVNHYGCINTACCRRMTQRVASWEDSITLTLIMIFMCAFSTIWMDYRLMMQTGRGGRVGLKDRESKVLWAGRGILALLAFILPILVFDRSCSAVTAHDEGSGNFAADVGSNSVMGDMPPSCYNNNLDGLETDIDCGGACSTKCVLNEACSSDTDCAVPMVCMPSEPFDADLGCFDERCLPRHTFRATGLCGFPSAGVTCVDGEMGQRETCVDGGGPQCRALGQRCLDTCVVDDDCQAYTLGLRCEQYRCVTCLGGEKDGGETDVDCGGPTCSPCADGLRCLTHHDCRSEHCYFATGRCVSYTNNIKDGSESGIDCGGDAPRRCQLSAECDEDSDCESGNCVLSVCMEPDPAEQCWSNAQDGLETCVDAGGPVCRSFGLACPEGEGCSETSDCRTGLHCFENVCASCSNGIIDGDESDVDCGVICGACADGGACTSNEQCLHNSYCYFSEVGETGECASAYNNRRDADESCIDGGGQAAMLFNRVCPIDATCNADYDCITGNCGESGRCIADDVRGACLDGVQNGWETDVDCGGRSCRSVGQMCNSQTAQLCSADVECLTACQGLPCPCYHGRCGEPQRCLAAEDCASGVCSYDGYCRSCANGVFDGHETDVDCGGDCEACESGRVCLGHSDCTSGACEVDYTTGLPWKVCVSCFNGVRDGSEDDVDCGGNCVRRCPIGGRCTEASDCASGACDSSMLLCVRQISSVGSCSNGERDHGEADTDCGGDCSDSQPLCPSGSICLAPDDCDSYLCDTSLHRCVSCNDGALNGDETDVDCGGAVCQTCADSLRCDVDSDCSSHRCAGPAGGVMVCSSCTNGIQDGTESDVDCGSTCPTQCLDDHRCFADEDCISMHCDTDGLCARVDPATTCTDGVRREHETCIDGGGPQCNAIGLHCALGEHCHVDDDCNSGNCHSDACVSCVDGVQNGDETDVDCGGSRCDQCPDGDSCLRPYDCIHQACWFRNSAVSSGTCFSHTNGIRDGDETCPDGGGPTSGTACENGESCQVDSDCISTKCAPSCSETASVSVAADLAACADVSVLDDETACLAVMGSVSTSTAVCTYSGQYTKICQMQHPEITCNDNSQGQLETDVDCGGDACRSRSGGICLLGQGCAVDADCEIGARCSPPGSGPQVCTAISCLDGTVSGDESDVDCGGACDACVPGQLCRTGADCLSTDTCLESPTLASQNSTAVCARVTPVIFSAVRCGEVVPGTTGVCPANPAMDCGQTCEPDKTCPVGCADAPTGSTTSFEISTGDVLMHTILVEASEPYGVEGQGLSCDITVHLVVTGGLTISFPGEHSAIHNDLGFDQACQEHTSVVMNSHNDATLTGPVGCIAVLLDAYQLDTTCSTIWNDGDDPSHLDDTVDAGLTVRLLQTNLYCTLPETTIMEFAVRIVGRPQLDHRGTVTAAASSFTGRRSPYGISEMSMSGKDVVCAEHVATLSNCEWGCCDLNPAMVSGGVEMSCAHLFMFGFTCSTIGVLGDRPVTTSVLCPDSCDACGSPPEPSDVVTTTQASPMAGAFSLDVPFTATSRVTDTVGTMVTYIQDGTLAQMITSGYVATTVTTPLHDKMVQVGAIPLAAYGSRRGPVVGRCVAPSVWGASHALRGQALAVARLRGGHLLYPADADIIAQVDVDLQSGGSFEFDDQDAGTYTVECIGSSGTDLSDRRGAERLVVVQGDAPLELPQVILMPGTPQQSPAAITVVISWDEYGDAENTLIDAHATCTVFHCRCRRVPLLCACVLTCFSAVQLWRLEPGRSAMCSMVRKHAAERSTSSTARRSLAVSRGFPPRGTPMGCAPRSCRSSRS